VLALKSRKEEEEELRKMNKLLELRDKVEQKREERVMRKIHGNKHFNSVKRKKPLYKEIEEKYEQEIAIPENERIKQDLAERKKLYQPIRRTEIEDHARVYDENLKEMEDILRR